MYKVLLTGNNKTVINEFFTYLDDCFECMSTSDHYDDIMNHIKYVRPDVFVYCLFKERPDDLKRFSNIERQITSRNIPIVIVGDFKDCNEFTKMVPQIDPLILQKPIAVQKIAAEIVDMLKKRKKPEDAKAGENPSAKKSAPDVKKPSKAEAAAEEKRKKHILIVDDDSRMLRLLQGYLAERYELATAINGRVAMKFLETKETDLVLLDYEMPDENGAAVLEKIRANEKTKNLPVVFLTGVTEGNKIKDVLALKPQGYLLKPVDMEKLSSTIKGVLG